MHKLTLSIVAALALTGVGCKKNNDALGKLQGFEKTMCECKDQACAEKVNLEMAQWKMDLAKAGNVENDKPDPAEAAKVGEVMGKYADCATKLIAGTVTNATGK